MRCRRLGSASQSEVRIRGLEPCGVCKWSIVHGSGAPQAVQAQTASTAKQSLSLASNKQGPKQSLSPDRLHARLVHSLTTAPKRPVRGRRPTLSLATPDTPPSASSAAPNADVRARARSLSLCVSQVGRRARIRHKSRRLPHTHLCGKGSATTARTRARAFGSGRVREM